MSLKEKSTNFFMIYFQVILLVDLQISIGYNVASYEYKIFGNKMMSRN